MSSVLLPYIKYKSRRISSAEEALRELFSESLFGFLFRPMQIEDEIRELLLELQKRRPRYVLEIGTARGGTLFLWTRVASSDAVIISIDLPGGAFGGGYPWLRRFAYKLFAREEQRVVLLRSDSHDEATLVKIRGILGGEQVDFLFIDGDHSYEGVRKDYEMYSSLVKKGGIIAFHDIVPGPPRLVGGVPRFWRELKEKVKGVCSV